MIGALDAAPETSPLPPDVGGAASSASRDPVRDVWRPAAAGHDDPGSPALDNQLVLIGGEESR